MIYWLTHAGGYGMDQGLELISDQEGSVYMTGLFSGVAHFGDQHIESQGKADVFVAKYTGTIDPLWIKRAGGNYLDYGYSISKDSQDALYICGNFQEEAAFGNHIIEGVGGMDMFVAKLSQEDESVPEHSMGAIILSPNPNTGNFEIKLPPVAKNKTLVIYDLKGKMVFHQDIKAYSNTVEILTNLTPGTYVLEITGTSFRQKLLIQ